MKKWSSIAQSLLLALAGGAVVAAAGRVGTPIPVASALAASPLVAAGNGFTYQGRLTDGGSPANGAHDFQFSLFTAASGGTQVGSTISQTTTLTDGLFTVTLDFGATVFQGDARFLNIQVRPSGGGAFTMLSPRQEMASAPYALHAQRAPWVGVSGKPAGYDPLRYSNNLSQYDVAGTGQFTSVAIGADGLPLISYYDVTNGDLKVAHCEEVDCDTAALNTLDSAGNVGQYTSIAIGVDGLGLISYFDVTNGNLKVAHCNDLACSSATVSTLDSTGSVGQYTSITIGFGGTGLISYHSITSGDLKVASCSNTACTAASLFTVDNSANIVGRNTSITLGLDGFGLISHHDGTATSLKIAHCLNQACTTTENFTVDDPAGLSVGQDTSITLGADGLGLISYFDVTNGNLKVAHCNNTSCSSVTAITADSSANIVGEHASISVRPNGLPLVSYFDATIQQIKLAHCVDVKCSGVTISGFNPNAGSNKGSHLAMALGADGVPFLSYLNSTGSRLEVLHCGSPMCVQHYRGR
jgi:hypothetical protein